MPSSFPDMCPGGAFEPEIPTICRLALNWAPHPSVSQFTRGVREPLIDHAMAAPLASVGRRVRSAAFPLQLVGRSFQIGRQVEHLRRGIVSGWSRRPPSLPSGRRTG